MDRGKGYACVCAIPHQKFVTVGVSTRNFGSKICDEAIGKRYCSRISHDMQVIRLQASTRHGVHSALLHGNAMKTSPNTKTFLPVKQDFFFVLNIHCSGFPSSLRFWCHVTTSCMNEHSEFACWPYPPTQLKYILQRRWCMFVMLKSLANWILQTELTGRCKIPCVYGWPIGITTRRHRHFKQSLTWFASTSRVRQVYHSEL